MAFSKFDQFLKNIRNDIDIFVILIQFPKNCLMTCL
jgi:hypothetical protein